jgi:phospholipase/carboxylesterase
MSIASVIARHQLRQHGSPPDKARAVVLLIHGRGASAESILPLGDMIGVQHICYVAPQAQGATWYPQSFMAPTAANEPFQSQALTRMATIIADLLAAGVEAEKLGVIGFSQGACLAAEAALRNARPYGLVGVLSGGAIGPPGTARNYAGSLAGARVFLGCADHDAHIPLSRVQETTALFRGLGADVTERIYPGTFHGVNDDELMHLRTGLSALLTS